MRFVEFFFFVVGVCVIQSSSVRSQQPNDTRGVNAASLLDTKSGYVIHLETDMICEDGDRVCRHINGNFRTSVLDHKTKIRVVKAAVDKLRGQYLVDGYVDVCLDSSNDPDCVLIRAAKPLLAIYGRRVLTAEDSPSLARIIAHEVNSSTTDIEEVDESNYIISIDRVCTDDNMYCVRLSSLNADALDLSRDTLKSAVDVLDNIQRSYGIISGEFNVCPLDDSHHIDMCTYYKVDGKRLPPIDKVSKTLSEEDGDSGSSGSDGGGSSSGSDEHLGSLTFNKFKRH